MSHEVNSMKSKDLSEIEKSLSKIHPFSKEQLDLFMGQLDFISLKRKDFLLKESQVSDGIAFILNGSFRFFKNLDHGELTIKFFVENNWIADLESLLSQQPSTIYYWSFGGFRNCLYFISEYSQTYGCASWFSKVECISGWLDNFSFLCRDHQRKKSRRKISGAIIETPPMDKSLPTNADSFLPRNDTRNFE